MYKEKKGTERKEGGRTRSLKMLNRTYRNLFGFEIIYKLVELHE